MSRKRKPTDKQCMDWLELQVVEVRVPLVYGSRERFICGPEALDGGEEKPSNLRELVHKAIKEAITGAGKGEKA